MSAWETGIPFWPEDRRVGVVLRAKDVPPQFRPEWYCDPYDFDCAEHGDGTVDIDGGGLTASGYFSVDYPRRAEDIGTDEILYCDNGFVGERRKRVNK